MYSNDDEFVFFDLETNGINDQNRQKDINILSIGAVTRDGASKFYVYLKPKAEISEENSEYHGISHDSRTGRMFYRGQRVTEPVYEPADGLDAFLDFLAEHKPASGKVNLVAHFGIGFDYYVLGHYLVRYGKCHRVDGLIGGFFCSYKLAQVLRERGKRSLQDLSLEYLGCRQPATHHALEDAEQLRSIVAAMAQRHSLGSIRRLLYTRSQYRVNVNRRINECREIQKQK